MSININSAETYRAKLEPNRAKDIKFNVGRVWDSFTAEWKAGIAPRIVKPEGFHLRDIVTNEQVQKTVAQTAALGAEIGGDDVPILGDMIYDSITNASFPRVLSGDEFIGGEAVYAEVPEGAEIPHGSVVREVGNGLTIKKYAAMFEITEEVQEFNEDWIIDAKSKALGNGFRKLVNHLRLSPIIGYNYAADNQTAISYVKADGTAGASGAGNYELYRTIYATIAAGMDTAAKAGRPASVILCNSSDARRIRAIADGIALANGINLPPLGITGIEVYDGDSTTVRGEAFAFTGCTAGTIYLIRPKRGFFERVKKPFTVGLGDADSSRGILNEIIGKTYRGYYVSIANNVEQVTIPTA